MQTEEIKKIIEEFLRKLCVEFDSVDVIGDKTAKTLKFLVRTKDSNILIGARGANLIALNHLVKKIASKGKEEDEFVNFFVDVNDYREKAMNDLMSRVKIMAERARSFKVDIELEPMSSYERMLVHSFFQEQKDLKTESKGEGRERRVVIKYVQEI